MTELKTLKDFDLNDDKYYFAAEQDIPSFITDLRAEAIKWIKYLEEDYTENWGEIVWISKFFNITEEELK